ncbi:MAG: acyltransferase [Bacteroidales bacterium]|nr:acyltransferase [Bacteroidales bacterium]
MKEQRIVFIDYIRVVACFLVMLVHASENFYSGSAAGLVGHTSLLPDETTRFWVSFYDGTVARTCVPLFMIVSAFLLVPMKPGQTMGSFYRRRFKRVVPPTIAFLLLYIFLPFVFGWFDWSQVVADLKTLPFNFPSMAGHLWFMYPLIGLYLIIPIVSPWLEKSSAREERVFIGLFILSTFIPWIHQWITPEVWGECFWNRFHVLWYFSGYLGYLVLAHYIRYHLDWSRSKKLTVGWLSFIIGAAFTGWSFWMKAIPGQVISTPVVEWSWEFCTPNVLLATFGIFLVFSCIRREKAPALVSSLSRLSFGMYLMHIFFLVPIANLVIGGNAAFPAVPVWLAIPLIALLTYICCAVTTKLISLIPGHKWLIG